LQIAFQAALCRLTCRMVSSVFFFDHRIGSKAEQATSSVPTEAVVVAQPARVSSGIGSSAARIARLVNEIERIDCGLRECSPLPVPLFPSWAHPLLGFYAVAINKGGVG
jgi:hypothetical protein